MPPRPTPPFSPVLFAGLALAPLPKAPIELALRLALRRLYARRAELFARLRVLGERSLLIDPVDLPFSLLLRPGLAPPRIAVVAGTGEAAEAAVRGPLLTLIALARGELDGDALFFSRDLAVEGDTAVVVALRNALDAAGGLDLLDELAAAFAPAEGAVRWGLAGVRAVHGRLSDDLATVQAAVLAPLRRETARIEARVRALETVRPRGRATPGPPVVAR